ncbi:hypothetical protein LXA43DRAFT_1096892 [Ganoderma leucocontextum]|nr:hypothetical protein LXA43DRAFT_1096892 [Ganoderma leucocontextum]
MRIRQYSISSSPLWNPQRVSLTIGVVNGPALSGRAEPSLGVASTYLAGLLAGDKVQLSVRASNVHFHPPTDSTIPLVMVERTMQKLAELEVAKNLLLFGYRSPSEDFLYGDSDVKEWTALGVVSDIYVCGAGRIAAGVKQTFVTFIKEQRGVDDEGATKVFNEMMKDRYATDIFDWRPPLRCPRFGELFGFRPGAAPLVPALRPMRVLSVFELLALRVLLPARRQGFGRDRAEFALERQLQRLLLRLLVPDLPELLLGVRVLRRQLQRLREVHQLLPGLRGLQ